MRVKLLTWLYWLFGMDHRTSHTLQKLHIRKYAVDCCEVLMSIGGMRDAAHSLGRFDLDSDGVTHKEFYAYLNKNPSYVNKQLQIHLGLLFKAMDNSNLIYDPDEVASQWAAQLYDDLYLIM